MTTARFGGRACCPGVKRDSSTSFALSASLRSKVEFELYSRFNDEKSFGKRRALKVSCEKKTSAVVEKDASSSELADGNAAQLSVVMKFGGSSVASSERMKEIAGLILSFPEERPVIVLSAMAKTTNNLLLVIYLSFLMLVAPALVIFLVCCNIFWLSGWRKSSLLWCF